MQQPHDTQKPRGPLRNEDGAASIEFILVFPLLSLLLVGSYVWFDAFRSNSLTAKSAYTISDIASRWGESIDQQNVNLSQLEDLFSAHKRLLPPRIEDGWLRVSSICWNGTSNRVVWSYVGDDTLAPALADDSDDLIPRLVYLTDDEIPEDIIPPMSVNDSVLLTEVFATWTPLADWVGFSESNWRNRLVTRPRFVTMLPIASGDVSTFVNLGYPEAGSVICPEDDEDGGTTTSGGPGADDEDDDEGTAFDSDAT